MIEPPTSDDVYQEIDFRHVFTGTIRRGVVGWHQGRPCWVTLQVWDGPIRNATAATVLGAYRFARLKLLMRGYAPCVDRIAALFE